MSLMVEVASFVAGSLVEYARQKQWSNRKIFVVMFSTFFMMFMLYVLLFPTAKGIWVGIACAALLGASMGFVSVLLMHFGNSFKPVEQSR